jgi:hypothetical protein
LFILVFEYYLKFEKNKEEKPKTIKSQIKKQNYTKFEFSREREQIKVCFLFNQLKIE